MEQPLVSVIIPSFNRFEYLLNAVESVYNQNYQNIEIIIINDCSTDKRYYSYSFPKEVIKIDLKNNQKNELGYVSAGHIRNFGINQAKGKYIATLDDDDIWLKGKLINQIQRLENSKNKMSSTDGFLDLEFMIKIKIMKFIIKNIFIKGLQKSTVKLFFQIIKNLNFQVNLISNF